MPLPATTEEKSKKPQLEEKRSRQREAEAFVVP